MKLVIINYGAGNIQSLKFAFKRLDITAVLSDDKREIQNADKVIFPGVGEASSAMEKLRHTGLDEIIPTLKQPVLGICLGMQLFASFGHENQLTEGLPYGEMNKMALEVPIGSEGLRILPFGNGAERMLNNKNDGGRILNLNFNIHKKQHIFRAALEGIAFSFVYGLEILRNDGVDLSSIKAGNDNLFRSEIFSNTISTLTGSEIKIVETTGAVGAARAAAYAAGDFKSFDEAVAKDEVQLTYKPLKDKEPYQKAYELWKQDLTEYINRF